MAIYAVLGLALAGTIADWLLFVLIPPLYARCALSAHELMHLCGAAQVSLIYRLMMVLETPICLGYREHRHIHLQHHRYTATEQDPEFFQIQGGHMRALANAMISPERSFVTYLRENGASRPFLFEASVRLCSFLLIAWLNPWIFLSYWLALRLSIGFSAFLFHHMMHNREGRYGTFPFRPPPVCDWLLRLLLGTKYVRIVYEHPAHHAWQQVKSEYLPGLLEAYPPREKRTASALS